ncbi:DUF444 family protein [Candidatus Woesearchaeota archaeon]|nr:DUF444 family protein [Candidatus Woesearchaeota archaeon]
MRIERDARRFRQIVKGFIRDNLREYIGNGDLFGQQGGKQIRIPLPHIELPRFRFNEREQGGVGQGDGDIGDLLDQSGDDGSQDGDQSAGNKPGEHTLEVDVSLEELVDLLGEELGLPNIEPRGENRIISDKYKVKGVSAVGPQTRRIFSRGYRRALQRQIGQGSYDPEKPSVIPIKEDMRYRMLKAVPTPQTNAVLIYIMDVSGSMGEREKELVRTTAFWLSAWLQRFYHGVEERYLIHDVEAKEVDRDSFFQTSSSGGTAFAPAYELCREIITQEYSPTAYNIYPFHFSDGDNMGAADTRDAFKLLAKDLLPAVNMFGYGQCRGSGKDEGHYLHELKKAFKLEGTSALASAKIRAAKLYHEGDITDALQHFLMTGK